MLSSWDDYPVHQTSEPVRFVGTSDRNFYDRYYFNLHGSSDELFMVMGLGQYPNLAVQDAFAVVRRGDDHRVVRASRVLGDRRDTSVGPFRVEVVEPLRRVRFVLEANEHGIAADLLWTGSIPAFEEPKQYIRKHGRVLFDTSRFAQTGCWEGTLVVGDETFAVTPDRWWGTRDRSWGVRPVGEPEHPGVRGPEGQMSGMWNYFPMQFDDHSILYIVQQRNDGVRELEESVRIWSDPSREPEWLGRPEYDHVQASKGSRMLVGSTVRFPDAPGGALEVKCTPLTHCMIAVGTGYGMDADWRHGMYQGELVVQGLHRSHAEIAPLGQFGVVDHVARFEASNGKTGYGLYEHGFFGAFDELDVPDPMGGR
ncbi:MAG: hypothetical protein R3E88_16940 [Myxococcota bacterium]|nr:hypothetical protein [Myxococcales bacterium]